MMNIVHALSAGNVSSDAIENLHAATVCIPEIGIAFMRTLLLNLQGDLLFSVKQLHLIWPQSLARYQLIEIPA